jgi:recombination protein RecT
MDNQIQKRPVDVLKGMLNAPSVQEQFSNALADSKDLFIASIIDLYNGDKSLQKCDAKAVVCEALKAAVLKLPVNKALGFSYLVVYNNSVKDENGRWTKVPTPTFVLGYKGYLQLAQRTGFYETINADAVCEGQLVSKDLLSGEVTLDASRKKSDKVIGYFAYFRLLNGFRKTLYMSVEEMAAYAKRYSPSVGRETTIQQLIDKANTQTTSKSVGWEGNFTDMALKTCLRRLLSKYGYLSVEMQNAMAGEYASEESASRDSLIAQNGNTQQVSFEDANFEEVDVETGEVKGASQTQSSDNEPDF